MGPHARFRTEVRASAAFDVLHLVGGGDPALTSAQLRTMAASARAAVVGAGRTSVSLQVDDDLLPVPTNATGWKTSYVPGDVAPVRPLVVDGRNVLDTALDAGTVFKNELVRLGVAVSSFTRGSAPAGTVPVTAVDSPPVSALVARMLKVSDNDYAELLHRQSSRTAGKGATWTAAGAHTVSTLKARGTQTSGVVVHDGSGLSRADRTSATALTSLLLAASRSSTVSSVLYAADAMPTAGVSGTLASRFAQPDTRCARGKVRAKTGTLSDVTALSGTAYGVDGRQRIFSVVVNGAPDMAAARFAIERFATAATGCDPA
jgi:D-alanyl-D-alanine carboxypeptidase/D-alanyl-D-alanine-endopeptidase (penicillin-binding protein 4)